jgi:hypothetical protein
LSYVSSWATEDLAACYQVMETADGLYSSVDQPLVGSRRVRSSSGEYVSGGSA